MKLANTRLPDRPFACTRRVARDLPRAMLWAARTQAIPSHPARRPSLIFPPMSLMQAGRADRPRLSLGDNGSERQVIQLDEDGRRIDDARRGRKRAGDRKHANAKRGTNGVKQAPNRNPHAKGKGADSSRGGSGAAAGGPNKAPGRGASRAGKGKKGNNQGKRRG